MSTINPGAPLQTCPIRLPALTLTGCLLVRSSSGRRMFPELRREPAIQLRLRILIVRTRGGAIIRNALLLSRPAQCFPPRSPLMRSTSSWISGSKGSRMGRSQPIRRPQPRCPAPSRLGIRGWLSRGADACDSRSIPARTDQARIILPVFRQGSEPELLATDVQSPDAPASLSAYVDDPTGK
jgi:hypothetical protein